MNVLILTKYTVFLEYFRIYFTICRVRHKWDAVFDESVIATYLLEVSQSAA